MSQASPEPRQALQGGSDQATDRAYENNHFGRTVLFGARYKM